jgi:hypothetical protein
MITVKITAIIVLIDLNLKSPQTHTPEILHREIADEFRKNDLETPFYLTAQFKELSLAPSPL